MASYTMLIQMAKDLGESDAADVLKENLDQEKEMAQGGVAGAAGGQGREGAGGHQGLIDRSGKGGGRLL
ncbi:MAG: DUF892 family protein [Thermomicrobiales bacterium]